jgi:hypothetical protein
MNRPFAALIVSNPFIRGIDVTQPPAREGSHGGVDHGAKTEIRRLAQQHRAQRDLELVHPRGRAGDVGEAVDHPGPGEGLEQHFGKIDVGHHPRDLATCLLEAWCFGRRSEPVEMNLAVLDHGLAVALGELGGDLPVGVIERDRQRVKMRVSVG